MCELLSCYTTFGIGGKARRLVVAHSRNELANRPDDAIILGCGSNVLVSDKGYDGTVVINRYGDIERKGNIVTVGSGARLGALCGYLAENSLGGMEWAVGIPGTVGGAVRMNAGAFGSEISERLLYAHVLRDGKTVRLDRNELGFGYRTSGIGKDDIVLDATFSLEVGSSADIRAKCRRMALLRKQTQPTGKSAGSIFKNQQGVSMGRLIDGLGFKGYRVGGAVISDKHANMIINTDHATARDVTDIIKTVKAALSDIGVTAQEEIVYIGDFG